ncbi:hypothetical protein F383_30728 [Gossypium arboreum]|uniref:Uncharacterized protein n=1 Tax=Gossypium arboreum TaxID=29729 RepID=A0A0B0MTA8_GOSAR|nr:hypothetical protein F383_30728 [Gossypium arboreum]
MLLYYDERINELKKMRHPRKYRQCFDVRKAQYEP